MDFPCTQKLHVSSDEESDHQLEKTHVGDLVIGDERHPICTGLNLIGRDGTKCSIVLHDKTISTEHAVIEVDNDREAEIYDLGSSNKTLLGKKILKPQIRYSLETNANIMFANVKARYVVVELAAETPRHRFPATAPLQTIPQSPDDDVQDSNDSLLVSPPSKPHVTFNMLTLIQDDKDIYEDTSLEMKTTPENPSPSLLSELLDEPAPEANVSAPDFEDLPTQKFASTKAKAQNPLPDLDSGDETDAEIYDLPTQKFASTKAKAQNPLPDLDSGDETDAEIYDLPTQKFISNKSAAQNSLHSLESVEKTDADIYDLPTQKFISTKAKAQNLLPDVDSGDETDAEIYDLPTQKFASTKAKAQNPLPDLDSGDETDAEIYDLPTQKFISNKSAAQNSLHSLESVEKTDADIYDLPTQKFISTKAKAQNLLPDVDSGDETDAEIYDLPTQKFASTKAKAQNPLPDLDSGDETDAEIYDLPTQKCVSKKSAARNLLRDLDSGDETDAEIYDLPTQKFASNKAAAQNPLPDLDSGDKKDKEISVQQTQKLASTEPVARNPFAAVDSENKSHSEINHLATSSPEVDLDLPSTQAYNESLKYIPSLTDSDEEDVRSVWAYDSTEDSPSPPGRKRRPRILYSPKSSPERKRRKRKPTNLNVEIAASTSRTVLDCNIKNNAEICDLPTQKFVSKKSIARTLLPDRDSRSKSNSKINDLSKQNFLDIKAHDSVEKILQPKGRKRCRRVLNKPKPSPERKKGKRRTANPTANPDEIVASTSRTALDSNDKTEAGICDLPTQKFVSKKFIARIILPDLDSENKTKTEINNLATSSPEVDLDLPSTQAYNDSLKNIPSLKDSEEDVRSTKAYDSMEDNLPPGRRKRRPQVRYSPKSSPERKRRKPRSVNWELKENSEVAASTSRAPLDSKVKTDTEICDLPTQKFVSKKPIARTPLPDKDSKSKSNSKTNDLSKQNFVDIKAHDSVEKILQPEGRKRRPRVLNKPKPSPERKKGKRRTANPTANPDVVKDGKIASGAALDSIDETGVEINDLPTPKFASTKPIAQKLLLAPNSGEKTVADPPTASATDLNHHRRSIQACNDSIEAVPLTVTLTEGNDSMEESPQRAGRKRRAPVRFSPKSSPERKRRAPRSANLDVEMAAIADQATEILHAATRTSVVSEVKTISPPGPNRRKRGVAPVQLADVGLVSTVPTVPTGASTNRLPITILTRQRNLSWKVAETETLDETSKGDGERRTRKDDAASLATKPPASRGRKPKKKANAVAGSKLLASKPDNEDLEPRRTSRNLVPVLNSEIPPRVLFTGLDDATPIITEQLKILSRLGGTEASSINDCSVLVTDRVRRTCKFLSCIGRGVPIVSVDWLHQCSAENTFLDPKDFILSDQSKEVEFSFWLAASLNVARSTKLLEGYAVFVTPSVKPPPAEMKGIVESCGARFLQRKPKKFPPQTLVVTSEVDKATWPRFKDATHLVTAEFILLACLQQKLDFTKNVLTVGDQDQ